MSSEKEAESKINGNFNEEVFDSKKKKSTDIKNSVESTANELDITPKGLPNLGNTCFFNSCLQCILSTHQLRCFLDSVGRTETLKLDHDCSVIVCDQKVELKAESFELESARTPFTDVLRNFVCEFHCGRSPNPRPVFDQITRRTPRFRGYQQQDAHELFLYLLDGLRNEELNRFKKAISNRLDYDDKSKNANRTLQAYLRCVGRTTLDRVFAGTLLQRIECCDCSHVSTCFEPFLDLSLPISKNHSNYVPTNKKNGLSRAQQKKAKKAKKKNQKGKGRKQKSEPLEESKENGVCNGDVNEQENISTTTELLSELDVQEKESNSVSDEGEIADVEDDEPLPYRNFSRVLSVTIADQSDSGISSALNRFTSEETLSASNAYKCEKCCAPVNKKENGGRKKTVEAKKRYLIYNPPAVLCLHLKRFEQHHQFNRTYTSKVNGRVEFPLVLDLAPYCVESIRVSKGQTRVLYSLYGVVCHSGNMSGGHYIAYVRSRQSQSQLDVFFKQANQIDASNFGDNNEFERFSKFFNNELNSTTLPLPTEKLAQEYLDTISSKSRWFYCSDSNVSLTKVTQVLSSEAYMLFYERVF
ncbi:Ubiquitin carboxyl-terminal hydrolase [Aphelenchoides besseyi]|nr:Ubiquitin carboxyl-terminal hydrolase [Aphelenchoides besseyi]KAI6195083.1 Ubiquitin carboxyl-terminal hydrolase [Aphelenchoides besseyi]